MNGNNTPGDTIEDVVMQAEDRQEEKKKSNGNEEDNDIQNDDDDDDYEDEEEEDEVEYEDDESQYEYETEEYYIVASLPSRALARASEAANDPRGVSARLSGAARNNVVINDHSSDIDQDNNESDTNENNSANGNQGKTMVAAAAAAARGRRRRRYQVPQYALIDLDTDQPMLELEGAIYMGKHEELLGTHLIFDIDAEDDEGSERSNVELMAATSKTIIFHPVKMSKNYLYK
ncbi:hypothetical protein LPJ64_003278 [Coemansia asiatica]|uniref:Transcription factor TFIIIC triple barrel domain-containing protein n=1 Tax=Coemansia asiatica TaxID=1052880 RepID=A0A9W8CK59_9FUNG|nr:hypothetical protein LPJ64_003278 [Coemansia asiatica]